MKSEWQRVKLGDCFEFLSGKAKPKEKGQYPIYGSNGLIGSAPDYMYEDAFVIGRVGAVGELHWCKEKFWASDNTIVARSIASALDNQFAYYLLKRANLKGDIHGSAQPLITKSGLRLNEISLPPLPTQRRIAAVLGALDDKIELNRKMNANLEAQAQALFKSWFVDFEPWGGKMPAGWKRIDLSDLADFHAGYAYSSAELLPSKTAMATIKNFERNGGFKLDGFKEIIPSDKLKDTQSVELYDILVAHTDLTQKAEVVGNAELMLSLSGYEKVIASSDLVKVVPKVGMLRFVIATLLKQSEFKQHCLRYVNGSTVLHLRKTALPEYEFDFPYDVEGLAPLAKQLSAYYKMMANNIEESRKLAELRDALLPKLMSGELSVSAAEPLRRDKEVA